MSFSKKLLVLAIASIWMETVHADEVQDPNTVVVTATLHNHMVASAPAFTTVITAEDIARSPINSIADLLRDTVGVSNNADATGRDQIQIRGLDSKYTLMLVNGKRLSSGGALWRGSDFDFSSIPLNSIKRVEIVRGPMAALYGSDAIGGVVNIITKQPTREWKGTVSGELRAIGDGDEGRQYRAGGSVGGAVNDRLSLAFSGEVYERQPWYRTSAADTTRPPGLEEKKSQNLMSTATLTLSDSQSIDFDFGYNHDERPRAMYFHAAYPWGVSRDFREQEITRYTYGLSHRASWSWGSTTAYLNQEEATIDDFNSRYNKPQQRVLKEQNTYAKLYASLELERNAVSAGIDLRHQTIKDPLTYLQTGKMSTQSSAVFAEDEIALAKNLHLTLAGRLDHTNTFGNHFSPKTYLSYQLNDAVTIKGGVSKAFKAPEAYQLSKEYSIISCGGGCTLSGNPDLKPETSVNYEAGIEVHRKEWNLTAVLFRNNVDDMIVAFYDSSIPARRWINVSKAKTNGMELQGDVNLSRDVSLSANLTHLNSENTDATGAPTVVDNRPRNTANAALNWKITPRWLAALSAHYTGEQFYESKELPAYTRADLAISARLTDQATVRFGVKNLTNVVLEEKSKNFASVELGRNYYVSASYSF